MTRDNLLSYGYLNHLRPLILNQKMKMYRSLNCQTTVTIGYSRCKNKFQYYLKRIFYSTFFQDYLNQKFLNLKTQQRMTQSMNQLKKMIIKIFIIIIPLQNIKSTPFVSTFRPNPHQELVSIVRSLLSLIQFVLSHHFIFEVFLYLAQ